jgi:hypothetical protein
LGQSNKLSGRTFTVDSRLALYTLLFAKNIYYI